eukprot:GHVU01061733.1.p1 GENE.GHVU01061733.1~~GHVU01061733.1.p1  ORF type:complete len:273 (-),score=32.36 GHVU01061733.1:44-862(-)
MHRLIQPDAVLNADETFLEYNSVSQAVLVQQGSRHVGSCETLREKEGITVMVTLNSRTSCLELPMLIFKGKPGANIHKRYKGVQGLHVQCNAKHWMNHETMCCWLEWLRKQMWLKGYRRVVIIVDSATQHTKQEVLDFCKASEDTECAIYIRFIIGGLTAILQPCDVYANKILKSYIRMALDWLRASRRVGEGAAGGFRVDTTRGELALVVTTAFSILNAQQHDECHKHHLGIRRAFEACGMLWTQEGTAAERNLPYFEAHLEKKWRESVNT